MIVPFADLRRRGQIRRVRAAAVDALRAYGITDAALRLVNHDFNTTYRVDTDEGRFALRININSPHTTDAITAEATWIDALARDTDLLVPRPQRTTTGELSTTVTVAGLDGERGAVLYSWLAGPDLGPNVSLRRLEDLGRLTARLHEHAEAWRHPSIAHRPVMASVLMDEPDRMTDDPRIGDADQAVLAEARTEMERAVAPMFAATPLLIHGDLHVWNTKWVDGRIAVFDFDDCGLGIPLQDLAISAFYVRDRPGTTDAILEGYASVRSVPTHTEAQFEALVASRNLLLLNSIMPHVTAGMDEFLPGYVTKTVGRLRRWLATGRFEM